MTQKSKVYFCTMRTVAGGMNLPQKLANLIKKAGIANIDFDNKYVAIKMHFGEPGNLAYLRPQFPKAVADVVKELGGRPFLTDCNTMYTGLRHNALDHLYAAEIDGFNSMTTGCHVIIGDGLKGDDEVTVPVNGELVQNAYIGRAVRDADVIIALSHFKGHEMAGFGGCIKNLGMGAASIAGKKDQHSGSKPQVDQSGCISCGICTTQCAYSAVTLGDNNKARIDHSKCVGCGRCVGACPKKTIRFLDGNAEEILNKKMAEYTVGVLKDKPSFHINVIMDVSPNCDCHGENDAPIIPNVGMLCSFDPVAVDVAAADLCKMQPSIATSALGDNHHRHGDDCFVCAHPNTDWHSQITQAIKMGLGTDQYELITIEDK
ncbi:MAG: DUF362 domain-containing protein [Clostridia bacterium]|nr:DUF362 domain-containing protein [Clostridia bacterium]